MRTLSCFAEFTERLVYDKDVSLGLIQVKSLGTEIGLVA